jgi:hypothetical protein
MRRAALGLIWLVLFVPALRADPPTDKPVRETWDAVYLEGVKAGSFHTVVREVERDGKKLLSAVQEMRLGVKREGKVLAVRLETGSEETADGKVVAVSLTQFTGDGKTTQTGRVKDGSLLIGTKSAPWNDEAIGQAGQDLIFQKRKVKPGDRFSYKSYELSLQTVTTIQVAVKDFEDVDVLTATTEDGKPKVAHVKKKLLRVEATPDKVKVDGRQLQLPGVTAWLDDELLIARSELELPGLGRFTLYRTTREVAEDEGAGPALLPDLLLSSLIRLDKPIERASESTEIVYRVGLKGDDDPAGAFAHDARQEAKDLKDGKCELRVRSLRKPAAVEKAEEPDAEFLKSSFFLDGDDAKVKKRAAEAVGDETDPWKKSLRIEKWVHDHMKISTDVNYVPASKTAADLCGDCRQHAMLAAALCRAVKIPSRTALGLVYVKDADRGPCLAFHMWTEVWVSSQWLGIDAVFNGGGVGADHIKLADHAWGDAQPMAPLLAVTRVMGKMSAEVVSVK